MFLRSVFRFVFFFIFPQFAEREARKMITSRNEEEQQLGRLYLAEELWKQRKFSEAECVHNEALRYHIIHGYTSPHIQATSAIQIALFYKRRLQVKGDELENARGYATIAYRIAQDEGLKEIVELVEIDFPEILIQEKAEVL